MENHPGLLYHGGEGVHRMVWTGLLSRPIS